MKKEIFFILLFVIIFSQIVLSQTDVNLPASPNFKDKTNEALSKQIEIPENLKILTRILFGLKADDKVDMQTAVVLIAFFIILLILIHNSFELFFSGWKAWAISLIVTLLVGISEGIRFVAMFFFGFGSLFGFLEEWYLTRLFFVLIIIAILFYGLNKFLNFLKRKEELEEFEQIGTDMGFFSAISNVFRKIWSND